MSLVHLMAALLPLLIAKQGVREISASSCDVIPVRLSVGLTTQIVLEQEPKVTLYADKTHFKVNSNSLAPRSLAIIPYFESAELQLLSGGNGTLLVGEPLAKALNQSFKTNLFVFFENSNQLMFELRFAPKSQADYILKVKQSFDKGCVL